MPSSAPWSAAAVTDGSTFATATTLTDCASDEVAPSSSATLIWTFAVAGPSGKKQSKLPPDAVARRVAGSPCGPGARQDLARLHIAVSVAGWTAARAAALDAAGRPLPGAPNIAKLWAGEIARRSAAVALEALGGRGTLHAYGGAPVDDDESAGQATAMALGSPAVSLVGGVDLVQRDLLGERVLGLPKSPTG